MTSPLDPTPSDISADAMPIADRTGGRGDQPRPSVPMQRRALRSPRVPRGLPLRAIAPNVVTALALCFGLSGIRFAISQDWQAAVAMVMVAAILDGLDGTIARLMRGESRFGAELDSLSDAISFGVSPALIVYLWSLRDLPRLGWISALIFAVFCALRLARFNAAIDTDDQPHKSAGYLTGIPAPAAAGLVFLPLYLWFLTDAPMFQLPWVVAGWTLFIALLMVSSIATYSWKSLRLRRSIRFEALAVFVAIAAGLASAPWHVLIGLSIVYLVTLPFSMRSYSRIRRLRAAGPDPAPTS